MMEDADVLYEMIRADTTDVRAIALHTGFKRVSDERIKDHLFHRPHWLDRYEDVGVPGEWSRFDSDRRIAEAWERLRTGLYRPADLRLQRHEAAEAWFMRKHGPSYRQAHRAAERRFPWSPDL